MIAAAERPVTPLPPPVALAPDVQHALGTFRRYLSDAAVPTSVSGSMDALARAHPAFAAREITTWTDAQRQGPGSSVPVAHHLCRAVEKVHLLATLDLVPAVRVHGFLGRLLPHLLAFCPREEREALTEGVRRLVEAAPAVAPSPAPPAVAGSPLRRRLERMLERIERSRGTAVPPAQRSEPSELLAEALAAAACEARDLDGLDGTLARLRALGLGVAPGDVFSTLRASLPDWGLMPPPGADDAPEGSVVGALLRLVALEGPLHAGAARFGETVDAAVEQLNAGRLARAVTLLGLAHLIARVPGVDWGELEATRSRAHLALSPARLKASAECPEKHPLLRKVLEFFPGLVPLGLLAALETERSREGRRLLVLLLEVHGSQAREAAFSRLRASLADPRGSTDWFFLRNLLTVLRRIPPATPIPPDTEVEALCKLSEPTQPAPLVKEALTNLGQVRGERVEQLLTTRLAQIEALLTKGGVPADSATERQQLLDHVTAALAAQRTLSAYRAVVEHALTGSSALGDPLGRLSALASCDLSRDRALVERLVQALRSALPVKVLGFVSSTAETASLALVSALSATPAPPVRQLFLEVTRRFEGQELGRAAARALRAFDAPRKPLAPAGQGALAGELEPFGLPTLLQTLERTAATGLLSLRAEDGREAAILTVDSGRMHGCVSGARRGTDAAFQLFERPDARSFVFTRLPALSPEDRSLATPVDLTALVLEGTRRHGELRRASALLGDGARLRPTPVRPTRPPGEVDTNLLATVWAKVASGGTPLACEAAVLTDSARVRRILVHWLDEGALAPAAG